jgi:S-methylmethionine-dependent homocysteine/selenocysteine methylase
VATTASYQASFEGFSRAGIGQADAEKLLRRSIQLADEARAAFWAGLQLEDAHADARAAGVAVFQSPVSPSHVY